MFFVFKNKKHQTRERRASKPRADAARGKLQRQHEQPGAPLGGAAADTQRKHVREGAVAARNDSSSLSTAAAIATAAGAAEAVAAAIMWVAAKKAKLEVQELHVCVQQRRRPSSRDVQSQQALLMRPAESLLCSDLVGCRWCCVCVPHK